MGKMRGAKLQGPVLHGVGDHLRHFNGERRIAFDGAEHAFVNMFGKALSHHRNVKHLGAEQFNNVLFLIVKLRVVMGCMIF